MNDRLAHIKVVALDVDGTFTDGTLYYTKDGSVTKGFSSHDGLGLELLRRAGIKRGFITGRHDNATEARSDYLSADFYKSSVGDKAKVLLELAKEYGCTLEECLFMGDDLNDLTAMEAAGLSVAVANARTEVKLRADIVTEAPGGKGAVREIADAILRAKGIDPVELWMKEKHVPVGRQ